MEPDLHGLDVRSLDPARLDAPDVSAAETAELLGWFQSSNRGFHLPRLTDHAARTWARHAALDGAVLRGIWREDEAHGASRLPVATLASWDGEVNTGVGLTGLRMIADITVAPTHRRRGLARRLLTDDLRDAVRSGVPLAGLTASEGTIYRRFGFGPATFTVRQRVQVGARFEVEHPEWVGGSGRGGTCIQVEPLDAWPAVQDVFARWHSTTRGSVTRHAAYEDVCTGAMSPATREPDPQLRAALHLDDHGRCDGFVLYRHSGWDEQPRTVRVVDMVAVSAAAHLGLWEFLGGIDLTDRVEVTTHVGDPLHWALVDNRCVEQTQVSDHLWLRVLDLEEAWSTRPWYGDGVVVVAVDDPMGFVEGTWRLEVRDGDALVSPCDEEPEMFAEASTLGSLHLGAVSVETAALAGRLRGDRTALRTFAAMADGGDSPFCRTHF